MSIAEDAPRAENPPKENLVRGIMPGMELREAQDGGMPTMVGHFAVFNEWTRIDSAWEGTFMERISPTAFDKTFAENRAGMRVLFQHGKDPQIGDKPLGVIQNLVADERGGFYEVPLFDTAYNRELLPGLQAGAYGASFRFRAVREDFNRNPERSDYNPEGIPERTITEAKVMEFGPVTFPAYEGATAGVRSLTDDYILRSLFGDPERLEEFLKLRGLPTIFSGDVVVTETTYLDGEKVAKAVTEAQQREIAPSEETAPAVATQSEERREPKPNKRFKNEEDWKR